MLCLLFFKFCEREFTDNYLLLPYYFKHLLSNFKLKHTIYHKNRIDKSPQIESYFSKFFQSENIVEMGYIGKSLSWWMNAKDMLESVNKLFNKGKTIYKI